VPPPLHTLKIWGAGVYSPRSYGAEFVFLFFVCLFMSPLRRHIVGLVYNYRNSLSENFTGEAKNVLNIEEKCHFRSNYTTKCTSTDVTDDSILILVVKFIVLILLIKK